MSWMRPKVPKPVAPVDPSDTANRRNDARTRRLASGGSNATFMTQAMEAAAGSKPTATLTGLGG